MFIITARAVGVFLICLSPTEEVIDKEPLLALGLAFRRDGNNIIHDSVQCHRFRVCNTGTFGGIKDQNLHIFQKM